MTSVWIVAHWVSKEAGIWQINGVFSTVEAAISVCREADDEVVRFELDKDCTDVEDFEIIVPLAPNA